MICLHFHADRTEDGNPRRCFLVIDNKGGWRAVIDEGYEGDQVVKDWAKSTRNTVVMAGSVVVSVVEYDWLLEQGKHFAEDQKNKRQANYDRRNEVDRANRRLPS